MSRRTPVGALGGAGTRRPSPTLALLAIAVALPLPFVFVRDLLLPGRFAYDAMGIAALMEYPFLTGLHDFGSFADMAAVYTAIGLGSRDRIIAGLLGYGALSAAVLIALWRAGRLPRNPAVIALTGATLVLGSAFLGTFSKEFLMAVVIAILVALPAGLAGEFAAVAVMVTFGATFRPYWMMVAGVYVLFRVLIGLRGGTRRLLPLVPLAAAGLGLAIWLHTGESPDFARLTVNEFRGEETRTLIERFVEWPEPVGGIVNILITLVLLIIPLPLLTIGTLYHAASAVLILFFWIIFARILWNYRRTAPDGHVARAIAVLLSFVAVQALFEPDYGSALRHLTPLLPLMVLAATVQLPGTAPPGAAATAPAGAAPPAPDDTPDEQPDDKDTTMATEKNAPRGDGGDHMWSRVLGAVRRLWWIAVIAAILGAAAGWGLSMLMPKKYTATTELFVTAAPNTGDGQLYQQSQFFQQRLSSYAQLVKGDLLVDRVIGDLDLPYEPDQVKRMLEAQPTPQTVLITVAATSVDPEEARMMSDAASRQLQILVGELDVRGPQPTAEEILSGEQNPRRAPREEALTAMTIVDAASTPTKPSSPKYLRNAAGGGVAAGVLALLVIAATALLDRTLTGRAELEDLTAVPVLGEIPGNAAFSAGKLPDYHVENSPAVEGIRALRTNLRFVDVDNPPKIIAITSSLQGEGKTMTALNLSAALAAEGHSVCLVDGDLRRPRVAKTLGPAIEPSVGLSTILANEIGIDEAVQTYAERGFDVVASGVNPPNPAELLSSRACRKVLADLAGRYDFVIIDGPPLLPVTDGSLLAAAAEATILVVRYGTATYEDVGAACEALRTVNAHIVGTAFNRVPDGSRHGYRYAYAEDKTTEKKKASTA